jgi:NADPH:quinone reductase-like Zn-dependent oxidoreductase
MKAAVYTQYGLPEVLQRKEVATPAPKENEILVRIKATAVNSGDVRLRKADPVAVRLFFGLLKPKINILGSVFSGEVERVGKQVKRFNVGDQVFGHTDMRFGAYAEYICLPEDGSLALKPLGISHNEAAAIPFGGVTALHFIKKAMIKANQKVLIVGASGSGRKCCSSIGKIVWGNCNRSVQHIEY